MYESSGILRALVPGLRENCHMEIYGEIAANENEQIQQCPVSIIS